MDKLHYMYKITNQINQKVYIGQTINPNKRWGGHKTQAKKDEPNQLISVAMKKYGNENFLFEVIATCKNYEDANLTEEELIKQYDSLASGGKGYNLSLGGETAPKTEEWKTAMSAIKGGWIGREHTEENIEKNRQAHLGVIVSEETKQKHSMAMKKKVEEGWMPVNIFTSETAAVWQDKQLSEEHKQHISEGLMGREVSGETRQKISQAQIGKIISEEQRQKMSAAKKGTRVSQGTEFKKGLVPWNKKALSQDQVDEIIKLSSEGNGTRKISDITGVTRRRISKILKEI
jgi:group I intron endonuclease